MEIFKQIAPFQAYLKDAKLAGKTVGLVPTMGALHKGHISLVETSKAHNSLTVATIYVNPTQFNNPADLQKYPKTLDKDVALLEKVGCDALFCPDNEEMYDHPSMLKFDFGQLDKVMEGEFRPGHFSGVALVVSKLFNIVQPHQAYFGQKDWQQFAIIRALVDELKFDLVLHSVPTMREADGLAMSSRNLRLSESQRQHADVLFRALTQAKEALVQGQEVRVVKKMVADMVNNEPEMKLEYFEVADRKNLTSLTNVKDASPAILCIAAFAGEVRLIDNLFVG
ncbi:pantoate--beta-alanine ligase [Chryseolinea lacunae]|uniref:Pantothenate synthetase n=1 Tax=Chryseolinea lacunae TaxID=2801331 RepID=A0ABS1KPX7_9BACT|nr:pantoate--beta-alanine ligase [Chryseolinea lacunae]MBL0741510.1 pantoate--beta-alanine ligase [Chryseolinea lacunae]